MDDTKLSERLDWYHKVSGAPMDKDLADAARALEARRDLLVKQRDEVALYGARAFLAEREQRVALEQALEEARALADVNGQECEGRIEKNAALRVKLAAVEADRERVRTEWYNENTLLSESLTQVTAEHDAALEECSNLRDSNDHEKARARLAVLRECWALAEHEAFRAADYIQELIDAEEAKGSKP